MIINIESQTELSGFYVVYNGTIINEKIGYYGISHMIEHLLSHNLNDDLIEDFQNNGITWNAYTSPTNIVFYLSGLDKHLSKYKYEFLDKLSSIDVSYNEFELEKKVLLEEYTSVFNMQSNSHVLNLYRKLFGFYNSIGRKNDIENFNLDECKLYFNQHYSIPSKIINVSKNDKFDMNIEFNNYTNDYKIKYLDIENSDIEIYRSTINKSSVVYVSPVITEDWSVIFFINYMLSNSIGSPLYKNVRKMSALAYYIRCNIDRLSDNSGVNLITTETDDNKVNKLIRAIDDTLMDRSFLNKEKFEKVKSSIINKIETVDINRHSNVETYIKPDKWTIEKNIYDMTLDKVVDVYEKYYNVNNFYKSIDKNEFTGIR